METRELEHYTELLLAAAMKKCGDMDDARDLTQETLLAALSYLARGGRIRDPRSWLLAVLGRKYSDLLRRKYRQPTVSIGEALDLAGEDPALPPDWDGEAESVRRAVAYLAGIYREVIVRHYMEGQSVQRIASELGVPEGTVRSRLRLGRERVKRGMEQMENYTKQSYSPVRLTLNISGSPGVSGEPFSLVNGDLIAQNLLWLAYPKPLAVEDLARAVGIPAAYVEPVVRRLTEGQLMGRIGNRVYTDFMIVTLADIERYIPAQKKFVRDNFDLLWGSVEAALGRLRDGEPYRRCSFDGKSSLELYAAFNILDYGISTAFSEIVGETQRVPDRPGGGRWIAFGQADPEPFDPKAHRELLAHSYSGERIVRRDEPSAAVQYEMHAFGLEGFPGLLYYSSPEYTFFPENGAVDVEVAKLLCVLQTGLPPEAAGLNPEYLKAIPWLTRCKLLREEDGKPAVNVPVLDREEAADLFDVCARAQRGLADAVKGALADFLKGKKQRLPEHLTGVPLLKQYHSAFDAMLMASIREAMSRDLLYNARDDAQPPCPMLLVVAEPA